MKPKKRLTGHALVDGGKIFFEGMRKHHGPGACSCGDVSESLDSDNQQIGRAHV